METPPNALSKSSLNAKIPNAQRRNEVFLKNEIQTKTVCIYGAGGHASVVAATFQANGFSIESYYDDNRSVVESSQNGCRPGLGIVGKSDFQLPAAPFCLAIGSNSIRAKLAAQLDSNFTGAVYHPSAVVAPCSTVGVGTVVFAHAPIQLNCQLGEHVIVNTAASIDHECHIGDFAHISPNATLCGNVSVGEGSHIGAGATIIEGIKVGRGATVGAGAVVIRDVEDHATVVGCPARVLYYSQPTKSGAEQVGRSGDDDREHEFLLAVVNKLRASTGKSSLNQIAVEQSLQRDLELDSLDLAEMTVLIESKYGGDVFDEGIATTVQDVISRIKNR